MNHHKPTVKQSSRSRFARACFILALPALGSVAFAQSNPAPVAPVAEETVTLSPFTVSSDRDYGYRSANSISATRTNTPIKDVPVNIQVFTKDFTDDFSITNQVDMERYNASLINGGADVYSDNPIQQAYNAFLFRGFVQNWGLRDGIREYDPVDAQGLARVEVVKGPVGALYGVSYPGGVMNNITKQVDFSHNFGAIRLTAQSEGEYRSTVDANYTGITGEGRFGVRFNGAFTKTEDVRAHSEGAIRYTQTNLDWQPFKGTEVMFLAEQGHRTKPNGLSYFSRGEQDAAGNALGNNSNIPLQVFHPEIPYTWNWSNGQNGRSLDTTMYRGTVNQKITDNFNATAYMQFGSRKQIDGNGWDANGSGGGDSWEAGGGWIVDPITKKETIQAGFSYRDWSNTMHSYGATGVYKLDFAAVKNTIAFGGNVWQEKFVSRSYLPSTQTYLVYDVKANIPINIPYTPPTNLGAVNTGNGFTHEDNSNDNVFVNWQASMLDNRLKTTVGYNHTNLKLIQWANGSTATPTVAEISKGSPMYGVVFDVTKEVSVFANYAASLFPNSNKNSFGTQLPSIVGTSYEIGTKFELMEGRLSGTVSYYDITQKGGSQTDPNANNLNTTRWDAMTPADRAITFPGQTRATLAGDLVPGAKSESKGVEVDVSYQPTKNIQLVLSFAHNSNEIVEAISAGIIGQANTGSINNQISLLSKYSFTSGQMKGLSAGLGLAYAGEALQGYVGNVARYYPSTFNAEVFAIYNFKAAGQNMSVQLNVKNINRQNEYFGWKATGSSTILATQPYEIGTPMRCSLTFGLNF